MSTETGTHLEPLAISDARRWSWMSAFALPAMLIPVWPMTFGRLADGHFVASLSGMVLVLTLVTAAATDFRNKKIYNWTTYPGFVWALILNVWATAGGTAAGIPEGAVLPVAEVGIAACLLGALACFVPMIFLRQITGGGAGDVKLATVIGALLGAELGLKVIVHCYIIGGACILVGLIWRLGPITIAKSLWHRVGSVLLPGLVSRPSADESSVLKGRVALGPYFAAATVLVLTGLDDSWLLAF